MTYEEIRSKIKTGDLLVWSESGSWFTSRGFQLNMVRVGTMSTYNHVGIAYVVGGRVFVVEAVVPYVRIYPLSKLLPFELISLPFTATEKTEENLLKYVGVPYSKWEAIKAAFTKNTNNDKVIQCSKLANEILSEFDKRFLEINDTPEKTVELALSIKNSYMVTVQ